MSLLPAVAFSLGFAGQIWLRLQPVANTVRILDVKSSKGEFIDALGCDGLSSVHKGPIRVPSKAGSHNVLSQMRFQRCNDSVCFLPGRIATGVWVKVAP